MLSGNYLSRTGFRVRLSSAKDILLLKRRSRMSGRTSNTGTNIDSAAWEQTFWGRKFMKSVSLLVALFCSASVALADIKLTTKNTASGQSMTSTTYIKGARQRTEGLGYTSIYQCDLKRTIQINDKTRTYLITPLAAVNGAETTKPQPQAAKSTRRGGVITYTTTVTDTGERREMHGLTARHLKSKVLIEASEGACSPMNMEMETDGWYIDFPGGLNCATDGSSAPSFPQQGDCVDEVRFKTAGTAKLGHPIMTTTTMKFNTGAGGPAIPSSTSMQEVVEFSTAVLDKALFDIPAGYTEVKTVQELGSPY